MHARPAAARSAPRHDPGGRPGRTISRRLSLGRCLLVLLVPACAAGCEDDVVMKNPRTGMTEVCKESLRGFDPYSQKMACVTRLEMQGWTAVLPE